MSTSSTALRATAFALATAAAAALVASACTTKGQTSDIVISYALAPGTSDAGSGSVDGGTAPTSCSCPAPLASGSTGTTFVTEKSAGSDGLQLCLQVENRLSSNAVAGIRLNTNDFQIEEEHLTFTQVSGAPFSLPAGETVFPLGGFIPAGSAITLGAVLVPAALGATFPSGAGVRVSVYMKGHLLDNSTVRTSILEFLTFGCGGMACAGTCQASPY